MRSIFRFVPRIQALRLERWFTAAVVRMLEERDRMLEDYLDGLSADLDAQPDAATTVVAETGWGQATVVGAAEFYARGSHSHGSPPQPVVTFNTRFGAVVLTLADVLAALGYTPVNRGGDTMQGAIGTPFGINLGSGVVFASGSPGEITLTPLGVTLDGGVSSSGDVKAPLYKGTGNNEAARIRIRSGNHISWEWDGTNIKFYIDDSHVKTL